ncbi:hypothetical protein BDA96_03G090000 [Sorghum bicolor]|jgi:hypothetical protein|uniref:Uncharacterized protein n=1 Tax=Sorghum bicolor TaxID=4558 RepID=A0A921ULP3_SORBI|nr:hypothetical protein BDA96_03G090000 [Sorghum bicolor]
MLFGVQENFIAQLLKGSYNKGLNLELKREDFNFGVSAVVHTRPVYAKNTENLIVVCNPFVL